LTKFWVFLIDAGGGAGGREEYLKFLPEVLGDQYFWGKIERGVYHFGF
jgi:hypothetical protein